MMSYFHTVTVVKLQKRTPRNARSWLSAKVFCYATENGATIKQPNTQQTNS